MASKVLKKTYQNSLKKISSDIGGHSSLVSTLFRFLVKGRKTEFNRANEQKVESQRVEKPDGEKTRTAFSWIRIFFRAYNGKSPDY